MNGYKIVYKDFDNILNDTFFLEPMGIFNMSKSNRFCFIKLMFHKAHSNCEIISCDFCSLDDYTKSKVKL